jgi:hypothetical protein
MAVFFSWLIQYLGVSFFFFFISWRIIKKKNKVPDECVRIPKPTLTGTLLTAFISTSIRFLSLFLIGGAHVVDPDGGYSIFFFLIAPLVSAILISNLFMKRAVYKQGDFK